MAIPELPNVKVSGAKRRWKCHIPQTFFFFPHPVSAWGSLLVGLGNHMGHRGLNQGQLRQVPDLHIISLTPSSTGCFWATLWSLRTYSWLCTSGGSQETIQAVDRNQTGCKAWALHTILSLQPQHSQLYSRPSSQNHMPNKSRHSSQWNRTWNSKTNFQVYGC